MTDKQKLGRPRLFQAVQEKLTITLPGHYAAAIRQLGKGNLSKGIMLLWEYYRRREG